MRNTSPLILSLILAATALFLVLRGNKPDEKPSTPPSVAVEPREWPQAKSDITPDPAAVFGKLENGMRYMILPNSEPPNRLSLRLHIAAGSLMEDEDQRGVAHFLEHMVFNGTKRHKDANTLIR